MTTENELIIFDTETNGIPDWKAPSDDPCQPHIVQLAAVKVNPDTQEIIGEFNLIVKPDGWEITQETIDIHGITNEYAAEHGIPELKALELFLDFWGGQKRIAYNTTFDNRIIRIAMKRYLNEEKSDHWKAAPYECAMIKARKFLGGKNPKLTDAYKAITGKEMEGAHNAMADVLATMEIYFCMDEMSGGLKVVSK